jgi:hypothetical protein
MHCASYAYLALSIFPIFFVLVVRFSVNFLLPVLLEFDSMYFIVKNLRRQIEIPPDKFGKMIDVRSLARLTVHFVCL